MIIGIELAFLCHFYCLQLVPVKIPAECVLMNDSKEHCCHFQPIKYKTRIGRHNNVNPDIKSVVFFL